MKHILKSTGMLILFAVIGFNGSAMNVLTVSSPSDSGDGTLRSVIALAADGDSIVIPGDYNISLQSEIAFDKNISINGQGSTVSVASPGISGYRVFNIGSSTATDIKTVGLFNLNMLGGISSVQGGVIYVNKNNTFIMQNCTVSKGKGTYAGGLMINNATGMTVDIENCTFSDNENTLSTGNGGACVLKGVTTIRNCVFKNNKTLNNGAAAAVYGDALISNCYFYNNSSAGSYGGAIYNSVGTNGALAIENCTFESNSNSNTSTGAGGLATASKSNISVVTNCTFCGNSGISGGAVWNDKGKMTFVNCTFSGNTCTATTGGGALSNINSPDAITTLVNNIFAYNYNTGGLSDVCSGDGGVINGSTNILGNTSGTLATDKTIAYDYNSGTELFSEYNTSGSKCGKLADNGGSTKTVAIGENSVAFQAGLYAYNDPSIVPVYDQRNVERNGNPCLGAYEYVKADGLNVTTVKNKLRLAYSKGILRWNCSQQVSRIEFYNLSGNLIKAFDNPCNFISINDLQSGMYLIKSYNAEGISINKILLF